MAMSRILTMLAVFSAALVLAAPCDDQICAAGGFTAAKGTGWQTMGSAKGMFCLNDAPLDRDTLGHVSWSFLHSTAAYLPAGKLPKAKIAAFQGLVKAVDEIYACELCRGHFQTLIKEDPVVVKELAAITTAEDASLWLWKVHNMVTHAQYPNRTLFLKGLHATNQTALQLQSAPLFEQNSTKQLKITQITPLARANIYNAILDRWRAAGGRVAVPSMYLPIPGTSPSNHTMILKQMKQLRKLSSGPKSPLKSCQPVRDAFKNANNTAKLAMCPDLHLKRTSTKPEFTVFTMARCPFCARTMETLYPVLSGELWNRIEFKNKYILAQAPGTATTLQDFQSLHGPGEVLGDAYEACAQYQVGQSGIKWYEFVRCNDEVYWSAGYKAGLGHSPRTVSYTHLRAHETVLDLVCRLLLEKKKKKNKKKDEDKKSL
eukprot:TRINITY_DN5040_c0_g1_i2.p1 TRINITY_DN5040_c0_g1~~TRINITY_DN5040_c0_g1_i2.p1  ORF type:complete len:431 (+),score=76.28 TRINITY_DN5040_c0_g1_i2:225-1517(+)